VKKYFIFLIPLFLTGCFSQTVPNYKNMADAIVNMYEGEMYNKKDFAKSDQKRLDEFYKDLQNPIINLDSLVTDYDKVATDQADTYGTYIENDNCYIKYSNISFNDGSYDTVGPHTYINCKGYSYYVKRIDIELYDDIINNQRYNYRYLGYVQVDNVYKFVYRSLYDQTGFVVTIDDKNINTNVEKIENYELKTVLTKDPKSGIFGILFIIGGIILIWYLIREYNKNHEL